MRSLLLASAILVLAACAHARHETPAVAAGAKPSGTCAAPRDPLIIIDGVVQAPSCGECADDAGPLIIIDGEVQRPTCAGQELKAR